MTPLIVQPGVEMRLLDEPDAAELFRLIDRHRGYLRQWLPWVNATTSAEHVLAFIRSTKAQHQVGNGLVMAIVVDGRIGGTIGLHYVRRDTLTTEIGYWLAPEHQGRGIMTACVRRLTQYCFDELDLNRVEIRCYVENRRSRRIPERLGFVQEGILRQSSMLNGKLVDQAVYAMLAGERQRLLGGR